MLKQSVNLTLLPILCSILFYIENYCINNKTNKKIINNLNAFITKYFKVPIFFQSDFWRSLNIILITYLIASNFRKESLVDRVRYSE